MAAKADESADESVTQEDSTVNTGESQSAAWVGKAPVIYLAALLVLLSVYYWPCLTGTGDFFISDLSFYFQPFCQFIGRELRAGILPLWNPYLYSGMSQLAVPSPALFYPPSFLLFLLPFSLGLSIYMILHQLIGAVGTYLFLRRVGATIESSCFAALAFSLCAYNFTLIQNFTLPATICWLPLALYFCQGLWTATKSPETDPGSAGILPASDRSDPGSAGILPASDRSDPGSAGILPASDRSDPGSAGILPASDSALAPPQKKWIDILGLTLTTSMIVYCGRPEVGVPSLVLISTLAVAHFFFTNSQAPFRSKFITLVGTGLAILSGILLAAPVLLPGIEWASLSPRAQGLEARWVLLWSANWFDWIGTIVANPLGSLYALNDTAAQLRHLVLSRGGSIPFVHSSYISSIIFTLAIFGFYCRRKKLILVLSLIAVVSFLMASGSATPFAPSIIKLSPALSAFRYPVKLIVVPCLVLILFAVLGIELILKRELALRALKVVAAIWSVVLIAAILAYNVPAIAPAAAKFLVTGKVPAETLQMVRVGFSAAVINSSLLGLITCGLSWCSLRSLKPRLAIYLLSALLAGNLLWASLSIRQVGWVPYFEKELYVAEQLKKVRSDLHASPYSRMVNLYFDPLTVPAEYDPKHMGKDQRFFAYSRDMLLHNIVICGEQQSSFGYEAAETKDYKDYFTDAMAVSSQHSNAKPETMCDRPIHRFAMVTATEFVNTQVSRLTKPVPKLDKDLFELVKEDKSHNYRVYKVKKARPKFYFAKRIVPVESFADLRKVILEKDKIPQTDAFDNTPEIVYVLNRDFIPNKSVFEPINDRFKDGNTQVATCEVIASNSQSLLLRCSAEHDGLLYMADHFYPGWIAEIDGKPVTVLKANGLNRALIVPKGQHTVSLSYRPSILSLGLAIAAVGVLITILLICFERRR